ncbi:hypothetical protein BOX15_Mlig005960g1 [Macrostomum lignano]|nr:hypothetical protein BOX15_Mlig005960g1 [Macrostomum lignano]
MEPQDIERHVLDRKHWRNVVHQRTVHLQEWERVQGKKAKTDSNNSLIERSQERYHVKTNPREVGDGFKCEYELCGKVCKSKGGLTIHQKRMHRVFKEPVKFRCHKCDKEFRQEATLANHEKVCQGETEIDASRVKCQQCGSTIVKSNLARHRKTCKEQHHNPPEMEENKRRARKYRRKTAECDKCGRTLSATNMARHKRTCGEA